MADIPVVAQGDFDIHTHTGEEGDAPKIPFASLDSNLNNTSDEDKPISKAALIALNGSCEKDQLTVTGTVLQNGNLIITVNGVDYTIGVIEGMPANVVASKIKDDLFIPLQDGVEWDIVVTDNIVTFTKKKPGACGGIGFEDVGETGVEGAFEVITVGVNAKAGLDEKGLIPLELLPLDQLTPAQGTKTALSTGTPGQLSYDGNYLYLCYATNLWIRFAKTNW